MLYNSAKNVARKISVLYQTASPGFQPIRHPRSSFGVAVHTDDLLSSQHSSLRVHYPVNSAGPQREK